MKKIIPDTKRTATIIAGHFLEHYDITLYGFFAAILAPIFFPEENPLCALIYSFGVFAAGFLMRPFGGFIFGYIGDKYGRKNALLFSILLVTIPTLGIGLLPTYAQIGIVSPILLVVFRLLQGVCVGGEFSGAIIYVSEHSRNRTPGFKAAILLMSGFLGAILGTLAGWISTHIPVWGWRLPFILGGIIGFVIFWFRRSLDETPDFESLSKKKKDGIPIIRVFKECPIPFLCNIGFGGANLVSLYLATIHMSAIFHQNLGFSQSEVMQNFTLCFGFAALVIPFFGRLSDRIGIVRQLLWACILLTLFSIPLYLWAFQTPLVPWRLYIFQGILLLLATSAAVPLFSFIPKIFPKHLRYSGVSVSFTIGQALLGGFTPMIASYIVSQTGMLWTPGVFLTVVGVLYAVSTLVARKYAEA